MVWTQSDYVVTDDKSKVDVDRVHKLLTATYWATSRSRETVLKTVDHSICFSLLHNGVQIGFARVVTDYAVFAWIADVVVDPDHRGKGLGKFLFGCIQNHPDIPKSTQVLRTRDAHDLYAKFGFTVDEFMKK